MHRERSGSSSSHGRHSYQSHGSGRSSHHSKEHGRKHNRESRREKSDPYHVTPSGNGEVQSPAELEAGGQVSKGGGFEMGIVSRAQEESSQWFQPSSSAAVQATPISPPTYMATLAPSSTKAEYGEYEMKR